MSIKKVLIILLFPFITEMVVSCCPDCDDPIIGHYTNKTLWVSNIDNSGIKPEITNGNPVPKEAFGIRVRLGREKTACLTPRRSLFIQTAYASENKRYRSLVDTAWENAPNYGGAVSGKDRIDETYGGYIRYISDPDGHLWKLVYPPQQT